MSRSLVAVKAVLAGGLVATLLLAGCSSKPSKPAPPKPKTLEQKLADKGYKLGDKVDRILNWRVDGWGYIDEGNVVFNAGPSRDYLVTVMTPCRGSATASVIAFTSVNSEITKFDKLIVRDSGFSDSCPITELHELKRIKKG
ncbi:MAG: DUF6491 family protein [Solimonas sp.]